MSTIDSLKLLVYPMSMAIGKSYAAGTGFFIKDNNRTYFVTARHNFYDPLTKVMRNIYGISIYTNPDNWNEPGWEILMTDIEIIPVGEDSLFYDILLIPLVVPSGKNIHYTNIDHFFQPGFFVKINEVLIPGYPNQHYKLITTHVNDMNEGYSEFYTQDPSSFGASGSPVFVEAPDNKLYLSGIYSGRNSQNNKGIVIKAGVLRNVLLRLRN